MLRSTAAWFLFIALAAAPQALAASASACPTTGWVIPPPPGFEPYCRQRTYVPDQNFSAGATKRTVSGPLLYVDLSLKQGIPREQGLKRSDFIARAKAIAKKLGAKQTGSDDHYLMFEKRDAKGLWVYHLRLFGDALHLYSVVFISAHDTPMPQPVVLRKITPKAIQAPPSDRVTGENCTDPPWLVKALPGYARAECTYQQLVATNAITITTAGANQRTVTLTGPSLTVYYPPAARTLKGDQLDAIEVPEFADRNFFEAFKAAGYEDIGRVPRSDAVYAHVPTDHGDFWLLFASTGGNSEGMGGYTLTTVQLVPLKKCTTAFNGINFDFDKATIRPDSTPELEKILALFAGDAAYAAEVGGHTDNVGQPDYNQRLSAERASSVKEWLVAHGVAESRITTRGYGDSKPLVPNDTEGNRAKNRRVELQREHCVEN